MKADLLISDHRNLIYQLSKEDGPVEYYSNLADPSIFSKSRGRGVNQPPQWSVADEWKDSKVVDKRTAVAWRPANNDESMTINRVREYLREDPTHRNPITGELGAPRAYFVRKTAHYPDGCHEVLTDLRSAKREVVGVNNDGSKQYGDDRDETVRDHLLDCVRYSIGMRPPISPQQRIVVTRDGEVNFREYQELTKQDSARKQVERKIRYLGSGSY